MNSLDKLYDIVDNINNDSQKNHIANLLISAINDWREPVNSLEDYYNKVKLYFNIDTISKDELDKILSSIKPDGNNLWEIESLTNLLEVLKHERYSSINYIEENLLNNIDGQQE